MNKALFERIEETILIELGKAKKNIKIAVAWFTNPKFFNLILDKQKKGINIQILLADDIINFKNSELNFQKLIDSKGSIRISRFPKLMHHKFCLIDNEILITGSYNWTISAEIRNIENILLLDEKNLVHTFQKEFYNQWQKAEEVLSIIKTEFREHKNEFINSNTDTEININTSENDSLLEGENKNNDGIQALYDRAEQLYREKKYLEALELADKIKLIEVESLYSEVIESRLLYSEVYELISLIKWRQGEYDAQIENAEEAIYRDKFNYDAHHSLAIGLENKGEYEKAIEKYDFCIRNAPDSAYYFNRALANRFLASATPKLKSKYNKAAEEDFKQAIASAVKFLEKEENEDSYRLFDIIGAAKIELGQIESSKQDIEKSFQLYNESPKEKQDVHILGEIKSSRKLIRQNAPLNINAKKQP